LRSENNLPLRGRISGPAALARRRGYWQWRWPLSCPAGGMTVERFLGRGLACCRHPSAAWRVLSRPGRAGLLAAYFAAGYLVTLGLLIVA
jgi:hypothetical protein